jgi:hypothetical protein
MGIMLFELATGRRPFESDTPYSIAVMQVTTPPPSPRSHNPDLSFAVEEVIYKSLKKKREERYPHGVALSEALKRALNKPVNSIHDTQPGMPRPVPRPANPQPAPSPISFVPPAPPQPAPSLPAHPTTPPPSGYIRKRRARGGNVWMSAAVGGLIGCGLLAALVIIALLVVSNLASRANATTAPPVPTASERNGVLPNGGSLEENGFMPTLDLTSQAAYNALIPDRPTATPGIAPVGVRDDVQLSDEAKTSSGGLIYFAERENNFDLYRYNFATGSETRLTFDDNVDSYPNISPDGAFVAFQSNRDGDFDIYLMNTDGENLRQLTDNDVVDRLPAWSPDGEWIVFSSDTRGDENYDLYLIHPDGSGLRQLFSNGARNSHPRYSPDGSSIVFTTGDGEDATTWDIGLLDVATEEFHRLTEDNVKDWSPSFSPDGQYILYLTTGKDGKASGNAAIARMSRDGSDSRILYDGVGFEWGAAYSPTGTLFAFTTLAPSTAEEEVFLMDASGTRIEQLTETGGQGAAWMPR